MGGGSVVLGPRIFSILKEGRRKVGREGGMEKQNKKKTHLQFRGSQKRISDFLCIVKGKR